MYFSGTPNLTIIFLSYIIYSVYRAKSKSFRTDHADLLVPARNQIAYHRAVTRRWDPLVSATKEEHVDDQRFFSDPPTVSSGPTRLGQMVDDNISAAETLGKDVSTNLWSIDAARSVVRSLVPKRQPQAPRKGG